MRPSQMDYRIRDLARSSQVRAYTVLEPYTWGSVLAKLIHQETRLPCSWSFSKHYISKTTDVRDFLFFPATCKCGGVLQQIFTKRKQNGEAFCIHSPGSEERVGELCVIQSYHNVGLENFHGIGSVKPYSTEQNLKLKSKIVCNYPISKDVIVWRKCTVLKVFLDITRVCGW